MVWLLKAGLGYVYALYIGFGPWIPIGGILKHLRLLRCLHCKESAVLKNLFKRWKCRGMKASSIFSLVCNYKASHLSESFWQAFRSVLLKKTYAELCKTVICFIQAYLMQTDSEPLLKHPEWFGLFRSLGVLTWLTEGTGELSTEIPSPFPECLLKPRLSHRRQKVYVHFWSSTEENVYIFVTNVILVENVSSFSMQSSMEDISFWHVLTSLLISLLPVDFPFFFTKQDFLNTELNSCRLLLYYFLLWLHSQIDSCWMSVLAYKIYIQKEWIWKCWMSSEVLCCWARCVLRTDGNKCVFTDISLCGQLCTDTETLWECSLMPGYSSGGTWVIDDHIFSVFLKHMHQKEQYSGILLCTYTCFAEEGEKTNQPWVKYEGWKTAPSHIFPGELEPRGTSSGW